jgi:hypothetical protein
MMSYQFKQKGAIYACLPSKSEVRKGVVPLALDVSVEVPKDNLSLACLEETRPSS